ncbi:hypothetical protein JQ582_19910 [Bradyrhizobium japonicum]|uniref:hypothetical protein n=1 Tax=Bradyrhizobium japonicum TaxID=375 RepID=UPI001BA5B9F9|nr:hypothetical protein [Bradyrhizobium japonicum]MBR0746201.1 hypothetical protein [Bradyrhizobium japonicum]
MADEADKGRPVQVTSPSYRSDKTDDLRIRKDDAQRLVARYLREKMNPGDANDLANRIVDGIVAAQKTASRPALRGWRMIPEHPPEDVLSQLSSSIRAIRPTDDVRSTCSAAWKAVYRHATALPDDIVT